MRHRLLLARTAPLLALVLLASPAAAQGTGRAPTAGRAGPTVAPGAMATLGRADTNPPPYAFTTNTPSYDSSRTIVTGGAYGFGPYGYYGDYSQGGYLRGLADVTAATGQYWKDIQSAKMSREYAAQMNIDTRRKQLMWELEYEKYRPTSQKMMRAEKDFDRDWARRYAQNSEIWSGRTLNILLDSILESGRISQGPNIPLDDDTLRGVNLTDQTSRANGGMLKQDAKLAWPEALDSEAFDETRDRFSKNWALARQQVMNGGQVERPTLRDLQADLKSLSDKLDGGVRDISLGKSIEARRYLNQLKDGVKALQETRSGKALNPTLVGQARNVAEMCAYMAKKGLRFAPAIARGDEPCYSSLYYSLRKFEGSVGMVATAQDSRPPSP